MEKKLQFPIRMEDTNLVDLKQNTKKGQKIKKVGGTYCCWLTIPNKRKTNCCIHEDFEKRLHKWTLGTIYFVYLIKSHIVHNKGIYYMLCKRLATHNQIVDK